jgi:hypothetical protein
MRRKSEQSFNEYEAGQSLLLSRQDTRIVQLEAENEGKDKAIRRLLFVVAALGLSWVVFIAVKVCRFLKIIPA